MDYADVTGVVTLGNYAFDKSMLDYVPQFDNIPGQPTQRATGLATLIAFYV